MTTAEMIGREYVEWRPRGHSIGPPAVLVETPWWRQMLGQQRIRFQDGTVRSVSRRDLFPLKSWPIRVVERMFESAESAMKEQR